MTGKSAGKNCDVAQTGNSGCGVSATTPNSYGKSFNSAGGGYYAMERTDKFIKVFYWARNDPAVPADVKTAGDSINTDAWVSAVSHRRSAVCCSGLRVRDDGVRRS